MKTFRSIFVVLLMIAATAMSVLANPLAPAPGRVESQRLRWKTAVVRVAVSNSLIEQNFNIKADSDVMAALRRSLLRWESVSNIEFQLVTTDKMSVAADGVSLITIAPIPENVLLFSK